MALHLGLKSTLIRCTLLLAFFQLVTPQFTESVQPGCDRDAAIQCELDLLECKLFSGPAEDELTMCRCGEKFYGDCLRQAGCEMHKEYGPGGEVYMKKCVDHIMRYKCLAQQGTSSSYADPEWWGTGPLMCAVNCASPDTIDRDNSMLMLFNNYGDYWLRIRVCRSSVHPLRLKTYSVVDSVKCDNENEDTVDDFLVCGRWVKPQTFTPVALPKDTTYLELDSCIITDDGEQFCDPNIPPVRIYGNSRLFPETYDAPKGLTAQCSVDDDCLGTFCETKLRPSTCAPKLRRHIDLGVSGELYFAVD